MQGKGRVSPIAVFTIIVFVSLAVGLYIFLEGRFSFGEATAIAVANCILLFLLWRLAVKFIQ